MPTQSDRAAALAKIRRLPPEKQVEAAFDAGMKYGLQLAKGGRPRNWTPQVEDGLEIKVLKLMVKGHTLSRACELATNNEKAARTLRRRLTDKAPAERWSEIADLVCG